MKKAIRSVCALSVPALLVVAAGCAPQAEEAAYEAAAPPALEEIPITTASDTARKLFDEGQYFLDVGRGAEANQRFRAAVAEDPGFVRAHFA